MRREALKKRSTEMSITGVLAQDVEMTDGHAEKIYPLGSRVTVTDAEGGFYNVEAGNYVVIVELGGVIIDSDSVTEAVDGVLKALETVTQ
jgi:hypothetical protein